MMARLKFVPILLAALVAAGCEDDPTEPAALNAPANVQATAASPTSVTVNFGVVAGASSYVIERAAGSATYTQIGTTTSSPYTDATVQPEITYQYRVAAVSGSRQSSFSAAASVTTPADGPAVATISGDFTANRTLYADTTYTLSGFVHVPAGVTLTIEPGTTIHGDYNTLGSALFVLRGGRIMACGTAAAPIVFTSSRPAGQRQPGDWGGLVIVGNATINRGADTELEGRAGEITYGGGTNDADDSGELCYVRVEFAGYAISPDNELNAFTFAAVGSGTKLEYLQAMSGLDDHFEWFGGTVDSKYLVSYESGDDHFDASEGYRGRSQFMIAYQSKVLTPRPGAGTVSGDPQGIENDGCAGSNCANGQDSQPFTAPLWANFTLIGTGPGFVDATSGGHGMVIRRGTAGYYVNGVVARWPKSALSVRDATTTARVTAGEMLVANVLGVENGSLLHAGQQPYDTTANAVASATGSAASLFNLLPSDPASAAQFDWAPTAMAPQRTGGMSTFPASIAAKAGTFITPTTYRGAADPQGPKWWEGWTIYADN
ncbi:MAG TPA: fibronectin type III domain-containing protein [Longimicrobiales bacterium]|nr:fibronectin type III domain-containing protein [Longimicrobiales bacterium]